MIFISWPHSFRFLPVFFFFCFFFFVPSFSCFFPDDGRARLGPGVLRRRRLDGPPRRHARLPDRPGSLPGAGDLRGGLLFLLGAHAQQVPTCCEHPHPRRGVFFVVFAKSMRFERVFVPRMLTAKPATTNEWVRELFGWLLLRVLFWAVRSFVKHGGVSVVLVRARAGEHTTF